MAGTSYPWNVAGLRRASPACGPVMSDIERLISDLEAEYDQDQGFRGLLRAVGPRSRQ